MNGMLKKGDRFGNLTVVSFAYKNNESHLCWNCICDCGKTTIVTKSHLETKHTKSCGCLRGEKHGYLGSDTYRIWQNMKNRCYNPNVKCYLNYGGRGIRVCQKWRDSFSAFLKDMGPRPDGMTLERIDNEKGYFPENCKWATWKEQRRNSRGWLNILEFENKRMCLADWAIETGISRHVISKRLKMGWSIERALTQKVRPMLKYKLKEG